MKRNRIFLVALALFLLLCGCSGGAQSAGSIDVLGEWEAVLRYGDDRTTTVTFTATTMVEEGIDEEWSYSFSDNYTKLHMESPDGQFAGTIDVSEIDVENRIMYFSDFEITKEP